MCLVPAYQGVASTELVLVMCVVPVCVVPVRAAPVWMLCLAPLCERFTGTVWLASPGCSFLFCFLSVVLEGETSKHDAHINIHKAQLNKNEERFKLLEGACYSGKLIWKVTDYKVKKREAMEGHTVSVFSQPFYTSRCGYRLCARAYLNGDGSGKGTHLSLYFVVMRGEFDSLLQWPFRQRVTLMLLDQSGKKNHIVETFRADPNSSSFRRPDGEMNIASGCPRFVSHSTLENSKNTYIKDDTLFLKVAVDLTDLEDL